MPRKLKTFVTTSGFYDLAVAAPSMKAALEIWGARGNLFQQGFAKQTDDTDIVKATMAKPGVILRRAVGTKGAFSENPDLPKLSVLQKAIKHPQPTAPAPKKKAKAQTQAKPDPAATRKAAQLYDLAQKRREREEARAAAVEQREQDRRDRAIEKARNALDEARAAHDERMASIAKEREALDRLAAKEEERWNAEKERLEAALARARE